MKNWAGIEQVISVNRVQDILGMYFVLGMHLLLDLDLADMRRGKRNQTEYQYVQESGKNYWRVPKEYRKSTW